MKVLPSLLRKGKSPVFLKSRGDENNNNKQRRCSPSQRCRDGSFPAFGMASSPDNVLIEPNHDAHKISSCPEPSRDCRIGPNSANTFEAPPILPTISYPPLSDDPSPIHLNSLHSHYQYNHRYPQEDDEDAPYSGIQKYYNTSNYNAPRKLYGSDRPLNSFDKHCRDTMNIIAHSPVETAQFESLTKFQGLKRDISLLGLMRRRSSSSTTSETTSSLLDDVNDDDGLGALEELTKSQEPDVYLEDDSCDLEFSRASDDDDTDQVTVDSSTVESRSEEVVTSAMGDKAVSSSLEEEGGGVKAVDEEEDTAFFSECEYDTKTDTTLDLTKIYEIRKEIKVTTMEHGDLDTIDENASHDGSSSCYSLNDEGSVSSSYLFSLVDDGADDMWKMKRRKRNKVRTNRRSRRQQKRGPLFSPSLMQEELHNDIIAAAQPQDVQQEYDDDYNAAGCPCSLSFTKVKQDVKNTYMDATKALNQVLHAFFVVEDDVSSMADKIRGAKFQERKSMAVWFVDVEWYIGSFIRYKRVVALTNYFNFKFDTHLPRIGSWWSKSL